MFHGHYLPIKSLNKAKRIFLIVRDGRDVMISEYFHSLVWNEKNKRNPKTVLYHRNQLQFKDLDNIYENLPRFIEYKFTHRPPRKINFFYHGNWVEYNEAWIRAQEGGNFKNVLITYYESLLRNTEQEVEKLIQKTVSGEIDRDKLSNIIQYYSFKNQSKRNQGEENRDSFLRKGVSGDWKNYFSSEAAQIFDYYAGDLLIALGYENDKTWININDN